MARYFFNIYDGTTVFDEIGTDIPTVRAMRLHMLALATSVFDIESSRHESWQMEVLNETGKIVASMDFGVAKNGDH